MLPNHVCLVAIRIFPLLLCNFRAGQRVFHVSAHHRHTDARYWLSYGRSVYLPSAFPWLSYHLLYFYHIFVRTQKRDYNCPHLVGDILRLMPAVRIRWLIASVRSDTPSGNSTSLRLRCVRVGSVFLGMVLRSMWSDAPVSAEPFALLI